MTDLLNLTAWFESQVRAATGTPEEKAIFTQKYFFSMRERANRQRRSGKCPGLFKLQVSGLDLTLLTTWWLENGFHLAPLLPEETSSYQRWLLVPIADFESAETEIMLWHDSLVFYYRLWYSKRLRHLLKRVTRIVLQESISNIFYCKLGDQVLVEDLKTITQQHIKFKTGRNGKWYLQVTRK